MVLTMEQKEYIVECFYYASESDEHYPIEDEVWELVGAKYDGDYEDFPYMLLVNGYEFDRISRSGYDEIKEV